MLCTKNLSDKQECFILSTFVIHTFCSKTLVDNKITYAGTVTKRQITNNLHTGYFIQNGCTATFQNRMLIFGLHQPGVSVNSYDKVSSKTSIVKIMIFPFELRLPRYPIAQSIILEPWTLISLAEDVRFSINRFGSVSTMMVDLTVKGLIILISLLYTDQNPSKNVTVRY